MRLAVREKGLRQATHYALPLYGAQICATKIVLKFYYALGRAAIARPKHMLKKNCKAGQKVSQQIEITIIMSGQAVTLLGN